MTAIKNEARAAAGLADDVPDLLHDASPAWRGKPAEKQASRILIYKKRADGSVIGMAVDAEGCLWVALFGGGCIERYSSEGTQINTVAFPCSNITKLVFGGDDLRTAYVTTALKGLSPARRERETLGGGLFAFRSPVPGLPQNVMTRGLVRER